MRNKDSGGRGRGACTMGGTGCQKLLNIKPGPPTRAWRGHQSELGRLLKGSHSAPGGGWGGRDSPPAEAEGGTSTPVPLASQRVSLLSPASCQGHGPSPAGARVPAGSVLSQPFTQDGTIRRQEGVPGHHPDTWDRWAGSAKLGLLTSRGLPGPYPPGSGSTPPGGDNRKCLPTCPGREAHKIGTYWGEFTGQILKSQIFVGFFFYWKVH